MSYYLGVLAMPLKHVEPEVKFVLVAFVQRYGLAEGGPCSGEVRASQLGLPLRVVASALAQLVDSGWLVKLPVSTPGSSGRPNHTYKVQAALAVALEKAMVPTVIHEGLIKRLIAGPVIRAVGPDEGGDGAEVVQSLKSVNEFGKPVPPGRRGNLSLANRLLLATLLSYADAFGVVSQLGSVKLVQLTGLAPASLRQRIRRLMDLGFIRSCVPGVSSSIFARKAMSTYFLNLGHRQLTQTTDVQVLSHWTHESSDRWFQHHGDRLRNDVSAAKKSLGNAITTPRPVVRFLWRQRPQVFAVLQLLLSRYASYLLSHHWSALGAHAGHVDDELRKRISRDLRKPAPSSPLDAELGESGWEVIIEHFRELAVELAKEYRSRFQETSEVFFDWLELCVIPVPAERGYEAITLLALEATEQGCLVLGYEAVGSVTAFKREVDIPLEQRYALGLLTAPRLRP
ncbi:hypothetical protein [Pseudomonas viridiflava]|uniref:hypothetical protein n=1 Tax=Pseudomonas viridiflava TaxID=33069 RepID=UPI000F03147F|nr:hypothetical protein [Pseudomonas viridiflava]